MAGRQVRGGVAAGGRQPRFSQRFSSALSFAPEPSPSAALDMFRSARDVSEKARALIAALCLLYERRASSMAMMVLFCVLFSALEAAERLGGLPPSSSSSPPPPPPSSQACRREEVSLPLPPPPSSSMALQRVFPSCHLVAAPAHARRWHTRKAR